MAEQLTKISIYCEVCAEQFSHEQGHVPRIISCGHTFCERCLDKLRHTNETIARNHRSSRVLCYEVQHVIGCPKCKKESILKEPNSDVLPKNFSYLDLIEDVLQIQSQKIQLEPCEEHPSYFLDMFCHDEEEEICLHCAVYGDHKTHNVSRLSGFSNHQKTAIKYNIDRLDDMIDDLISLNEKLDERKEILESKYSEIRHSILDLFSSIQEKIKETFDEKLEMVLQELVQMQAVQSDCIDSSTLELTANTEALETLRDETKSFLTEASECDIAKEKNLCNEMENSLEEVGNLEVTTQHLCEVSIDDSDQIVEILKELVNAWVIKVHQSKPASVEKITAVLKNHSVTSSPEESLCFLFGYEQPEDQIFENPFDGIGLVTSQHV